MTKHQLKKTIARFIMEEWRKTEYEYTCILHDNFVCVSHDGQ